VLLEGGSTSETYQFKIPSKSLFGQGTNNVHPFESYIKFLIANGENPDTVVTNVSYDLNADTMALLFTPVRGLTDEEYALVLEAQQNPETERYIQLVAAPSNAAPALAASTPATVVQRSDEPDDEDEVVAEPVKRTSAKAAASTPATVSGELADIINAWGSED
jgi:hypothetical protein